MKKTIQMKINSIINEIEKSKKIKKIKYPSAKRNYNSRNIKKIRKLGPNILNVN